VCLPFHCLVVVNVEVRERVSVISDVILNVTMPDMIFVLEKFDNRPVIHTKTVLDKVKLKADLEGCIAVVV
jgi:hypothetical protein